MSTILTSTVEAETPRIWIDGLPYYQIPGTPFASPLAALVTHRASGWKQPRREPKLRLLLPPASIILAGAMPRGTWPESPPLRGIGIPSSREDVGWVDPEGDGEHETALWLFWWTGSALLSYAPLEICTGWPETPNPSTQHWVQWQEHISRALWLAEQDRDSGMMARDVFGIAAPAALLRAIAEYEAERIDALLIRGD